MATFRYVGTATMLAKAQAALTRAVTLAAEDLVAQAQSQTPVDTGTLKASEHVQRVSVSGTSVEAVVATGGEANEYAFFVHEGTTRMVARPFLADALMQNRGRYLAFIRAEVEKEF